MTNQYTKDDVLYKSPVGKPITELRVAGEKLALYTEDNGILARFRHWSQMLYLVPYTQNNKLVAADLYFPKTAQKQLIKALSDIHPATSKKKGSIR